MSRETEIDAYQKKYGDKVTAYARLLAGNEADADDLLQEAWLQAWRKLEYYDTSRPFVYWFGGILASALRAGRRRQWRRDEISAVKGWKFQIERDLPDTRFEPARFYAAERLDASLVAALESLDAQQRAMLLLVYRDGMTMRDAAEFFGLPYRQFRGMLAEARATVRAVGLVE